MLMPQDSKSLKAKKLDRTFVDRNTSKASISASLKNWDFEHIQTLIQELNEILTDMARMESENSVWIKNACPLYRNSARNLLHYLALRQRDIRGLQRELAAMGLSSLGRSESHVMASVIAVIKVLESLAEHDQIPAGNLEPPADIISGKELLDMHTRGLLGESPSDRNAFILVTMPSEAAEDYTVIRDLVESGMDCMRINCAHDDARAWSRMIDNLRRAEAELNKKCRIFMDIAGNKVRTGPIESGLQILKVSPKRDRLGKELTPALLWLMPSEAPVPPVSPVDCSIPVHRLWLSSIEPGDTIECKDARGRPRSLNVVASVGECRIAESDKTIYISDGIVLTHISANASGAGETVITDIAPEERFILLKKGDVLILHDSSRPGKPPEYDAEGRVLKPATIGVTEPEIFNSIMQGEQIWFDDGKIGGVIKYVNNGQAHVEITHARFKGEKLRANKGVNLPDSQLKLPALTPKDLEDLKFIAAYADAVDFSFVNNASDVRELQAQLKALGGEHLGIVLKIETIKAFDHLPGLLLAVMASPAAGVMIARGDLAVECGYERMAEVQEEILWFSEAAHMPVIWATEVLEKMAKKGMPSRAEITDAAMSSRSECVMLNKGPYVVDAVKALDSILQRMQEHQTKKTSMLRELRLAHKFNP